MAETINNIDNITEILDNYSTKFKLDPKTYNEADDKITGGKFGLDFTYFCKIIDPTIGADKISNDPDLKLRYRAMELKLYTELGCEFNVLKIKNVYDNTFDLEGRKIETFKDRYETYERFYRYSIKVFLMTVNSLYYKTPGIKSGIPLRDCVRFAKDSFDATQKAFDSFISVTKSDSDFVKKALKGASKLG